MSVSLNGTTGLTFADSSTQNTGGYTGFRNRIINGAMGVWQRGTSSSSTGYQTADRWRGDATSGTWSQSTDVPTGYKYSLSMSGTNFIQINQRIESVNCADLVGQSVTISFYAKQTSGAGANSFGVQLFYANSSDTFSSETQIGSTSFFTGTTSWALYTCTFSGLSSGVANGIELRIFANTSGSSTILTTGVQLEKGSVATPFENRPYGMELSLCQRYYETRIGLFGVCRSATNFVVGSAFQVAKRTAPTVSYNNSMSFLDISNNATRTASSVSQGGNSTSTTNSFTLDIGGYSSMVSGALGYTNIQPITFSSEL